MGLDRKTGGEERGGMRVTSNTNRRAQRALRFKRRSQTWVSLARMSLANAIPRTLHFGTKSMSSVEMTGIGGGMVSGAV